MCCINSSLTSKLGSGIVDTANSFLDGSGVLVPVFTSGANGSVIKSITVKATGSTSQGMVRLFVGNGELNFLYREIMIPANVQTGVVPAFSLVLPGIFRLQPGWSLLASTELSETFNVFADYGEWENCSC